MNLSESFKSRLKLLAGIKNLNELDTHTYAKVMNNTSDYPWSKFIASGNPDGEKRANKMGRVNNVARQLFEREFYKLYPPQQTTIIVYDSNNENNKKQLAFETIRWDSNWTNYKLFFESGVVVYGGGSREPYILDSDAWKLKFQGKVKIFPESLNVLKQMFAFKNS